MRILSLAIALSVLSGSWALPLTQNHPPADVSADPSPAGCFVVREDVRVYTTYVIDPLLQKWVPMNKTITRLIRHCCDGYTGNECNERIDVPDAVICGNLTCEEDPNAYCAVVRKCGREIPMFLDENGLPSKKCNQTVDVESLSCSGVCAEDPCSNARCSGHPAATCFPIGCECRAVWLERDEESGESLEVNCEGSAKVRPKREIYAACNS